MWRTSTEAEWQETWVQTSTDAEEKFPKEVMQPVADKSVWTCLELAQQEQQHLPTQPWLHATMDWLLGQGQYCWLADVVTLYAMQLAGSLAAVLFLHPS